MTPEYYEGVVICTIGKLQEQDETCGIRAIKGHSGLSDHTILKAIRRLETKGRLTTIPGQSSNLPNQYDIQEPTNLDKAAYNLHLATRNGV